MIIRFPDIRIPPAAGRPTSLRPPNATGGPGRFVLEVHDLQSFDEAMQRKLITERIPTRYAALRAGWRALANPTWGDEDEPWDC